MPLCGVPAGTDPAVCSVYKYRKRYSITLVRSKQTNEWEKTRLSFCSSIENTACIASLAPGATADLSSFRVWQSTYAISCWWLTD
eukprot:scaffold177051_cov19-Prasinocladus_malaysianus.AAC.1